MFFGDRLVKIFAYILMVSIPSFECSATVSASDAFAKARYAGGQWSRNKILNNISKYKLKLVSERNYEYVIDFCRAALAPINNMEFEFIDPVIITDDWGDARIDRYKKIYPQFKFGMGIAGNAGENNGSIPRWNINIYDIDIDFDGNIDTVLYGEVIELGTYNKTSHPAGLPSGYLVFTKGKDIKRGGYLSNDPSGELTGLALPIYSALILINGIYSIISLEDFELNGYRRSHFELTLIGKQNFSRGTSMGSYKCHYEFNMN